MFTNLFTNEILDNFSNCFIGLHNAEPNQLNEVASGDYSRLNITLSRLRDRVIVNQDEIRFPQALTPWGAITHVAFYRNIDDIIPLMWIRSERLTQILVGDTYIINPQFVRIEM